ncbi:MAG: type II toxin-antitoxin system HicB family antitoxin [Chloroflexia bacterium]
MNTKEYTVIYESGPHNWSAYVPDVPGCVTTGKTRAETERNMQEALAGHLALMQESGEPIPEPTTDAGKIRVPVAA